MMEIKGGENKVKGNDENVATVDKVKANNYPTLQQAYKETLNDEGRNIFNSQRFHFILAL